MGVFCVDVIREKISAMRAVLHADLVGH